MNTTRTLTATLLGSALLLTATACGSGTYPTSGTVVSKETDLECKKDKKTGKKTSNCTTEYEIDLIKDNGEKVEVKAHNKTDYDRCDKDEKFPACTKGK